jgi:hypothetical protein
MTIMVQSACDTTKVCPSTCNLVLVLIHCFSALLEMQLSERSVTLPSVDRAQDDEQTFNLFGFLNQQNLGMMLVTCPLWASYFLRHLAA